MTHRAATQPDPHRPPPVTLAERLLAEGIERSIVAAAAAEGIAISAKTALRWALHGTCGARLESIRIGGRRTTSRAAIRRFIAAQQHDAPPVARAIDASAAERVLEGFGLGRGKRQ